MPTSLLYPPDDARLATTFSAYGEYDEARFKEWEAAHGPQHLLTRQFITCDLTKSGSTHAPAFVHRRNGRWMASFVGVPASADTYTLTVKFAIGAGVTLDSERLLVQNETNFQFTHNTKPPRTGSYDPTGTTTWMQADVSEFRSIILVHGEVANVVEGIVISKDGHWHLRESHRIDNDTNHSVCHVIQFRANNYPHVISTHYGTSG